jgi:hypothetical protein
VGYDPSRKTLLNASPGALGPACRLRRRYAHAPAGARLAGLGVRELSSLALFLIRDFN